MSVAKFERFLPDRGGLDVDKQDLKRYSDFINQKTYDLLLRAQAAAKANGRQSSSRSICQSPRACRKASTNSGRSDEQIELRRSSIKSPCSLR